MLAESYQMKANIEDLKFNLHRDKARMYLDYIKILEFASKRPHIWGDKNS